MSTRYFRAGVGTVIYNDANEVALFERAVNPVGVWQFQQGGIDLNEEPKETLWRELAEEIGLTEDDIETTHEFPHWTVYETATISGNPGADRVGQAHRWFFLKLKATSTIDITKATEEEVSDFRWVTFAEALAEAGPYKEHVYESLHHYFKELRKIL